MDGLLYLLLWAIINGGIGALIGKYKKRATAGAIWGFLVGPLGWLVIALGPNNNKKCSECGGVLVENANRCQHCGVKVTCSTEGSSSS